MTKLLEIKNLRTIFSTEQGLVKAVDDISFTINRGESIGIAGESGSGKSVTALSIMGLIPNSTGIIQVQELSLYIDDNKKINLASANEKVLTTIRGNKIGMVFQEPMTSLNPVFTCGNQVLEVLLNNTQLSKKEAIEETKSLFSKVKLQDVERIYESYPHQLSGGQKQRVMIAMAICCKPDLLIADEPTTALDVTVQKSIIELIEELQAETGISVLFISHDLGVLKKLCSRVFVMNKGKIVEQGETESIFNNPKHPYTRSLISCKPPLNFQLKRLPIISDFMSIQEAENGEKTIVSKEVNSVDFINKLKISKEEIKTKNDLLFSQNKILKVKEAAVWFPKRTSLFNRKKEYVKAVDSVSFEVFKGETLGLVGESGSGKTTLGRAIAGLQNINNGSISFENNNILDFNKKEKIAYKKKMQIIFQDPYSSLNPRRPIGAAIMEGMEIHNLYENKKTRINRAKELLNTVGLNSNHFNRYPSEFSGGQRQRICIARALAVEPTFLVCDESVSALDVSVQAQILNLLVQLREDFNLTYIFISHDLSVVRFLSDRIAVMKNGKIVELGVSEEIFSNPKSEYTKSLIAAVL